MMKKVIAASIGNCVHVAGIMNFLSLAEREGYSTYFLGAAISIDELIEAVKEERPDYVGVSYRLTPEPLEKILAELKEKISLEHLEDIKWIFGGTEPTAKVAEESGIFNFIFNGTEDPDEVIGFLKGVTFTKSDDYPQDLVSRILSKYPYPILRHHIGLPSLEETIDAIKKIAESKVLDVISIAPDQNAQEHFFEQEKMDHRLDGAGGVPLRFREDFEAIYEASRRGNYPILRCYSGTKDLIPFAEMLNETIKNAWCAVPLYWYSVLDRRGPRTVEEAIRENQQVMKWHGERSIPVEVNESHHWSLRDAHDTIGVVTAYLAAYNAKKMGVKDYVAQYMFNVPPSISPAMDLAKMLAKIEMIEDLQDENFTVYRQARAGIASLPADLAQAKGQLAASAYLAMAIKPHIYHVVGYCEAHHAATADDIIESCKIVRGIIRNTMLGAVDITKDSKIQERKNELIEEASITLQAIRALSPDVKDPLTDPATLTKAVEIGILDAPHLRGNPAARGDLVTQLVDGALYAYDPQEKRIISEKERIDRILNKNKVSCVAV
ncbi:MAG: cobalamin B12-binding domain-containing protein [Tepidanaerobacter acetatoxydans]|uniref:cobalamin B12-binding domain-containing protein n=1 Tax=Tepidanaerobacter acetatoxydans TaxID=499229 RepID=UPI0026E9BCC0|nr:cobalamin B12-binding domain-containing protein [Tepidanaerobacter acetatoxydans]NLU11344.1 cobalamin B12-binding domain-containing protein [Tepidanaerobacter acetatoxydans]